MRAESNRGQALRIVVTLVVGAVALVLVPSSLAAKAPSTKACAVNNVTLGKRYAPTGGSSLQTAIDAARSGDTIEVSGRCVGNFAIGESLVSKTLQLVGRATNAYPVATLDGNRSGSVLRVRAGTVTVTNLAFTNGAAQYGGGIFLGFANLTVTGASVFGNSASTSGGGVYVTGGTLTLHSSSVTGNTAGVSGGGIFNGAWIQGVVYVDANSTVSGNSPDDCVGCARI